MEGISLLCAETGSKGNTGVNYYIIINRFGIGEIDGDVCALIFLIYRNYAEFSGFQFSKMP